MFDNLFPFKWTEPPKAPMLKRSTHMYCSFCGTNLEEYRQRHCEGCLLPLDAKDMTHFGGSDRAQMRFSRRLRLQVQSWFAKITRFLGCGSNH